MIGMKPQKSETYYTIYNKSTLECLGNDFTIDAAIDTIYNLSLEDDYGGDWIYYETDTQILDSVVGLVEDHCS